MQECTYYLKKALLDAQERARDYKEFSEEISDEKIQNFFHRYAAAENKQIETIQTYLREYTN